MARSLRGMTWSHPRGYEPMLATARLWQERTGVEVTWEKRSLKDFESYPVEELARSYDLIVIDHPHVGQITAQGCLVPLDTTDREGELKALETASVGPSFASYRWEGRLWALPIDAATQVMAYREDLLQEPPSTVQEVLEHAEADCMLLPLLPPHSLMCLFTLCANLGNPCDNDDRDQLIDISAGVHVLDLMRRTTNSLHEAIFDMDPISAFEAAAKAGSNIAVIPYIYGYVNYGFQGFRANRLKFADIPAAGDQGPRGGTLGGTGIAVSAFCENPPEAIKHAYWLASPAVQRDVYASGGGQPAHADGWDNPKLNAQANGFYADTRATMEASYVRPRHNGYMGFQEPASGRINAGLRSGEPARSIVAAVNEMYERSFEGT